MSKRSKRKAFGAKKKKLHNFHHCKKKRKEKELTYKPQTSEFKIKHLRISTL